MFRQAWKISSHFPQTPPERMGAWGILKGQLISKCPFGLFKLTKTPMKIL
jgi:hypothetical protein